MQINDWLQGLLRLAAAAMGAFYAAAGLFVGLAQADLLGLTWQARVPLGLVLFGYGLFRIARAAKRRAGYA